MTPSPRTYLSAVMSEETAPAQTEPAVDETLRVIRELLAMGVTPKSVRVGHGTVEVQVHSVERHREERAPQPGSYLAAALKDRRPLGGGDR